MVNWKNLEAWERKNRKQLSTNEFKMAENIVAAYYLPHESHKKNTWVSISRNAKLWKLHIAIYKIKTIKMEFRGFLYFCQINIRIAMLLRILFHPFFSSYP